MATAGPMKEHLSASGNLEPFGHRFPGFNSLGASHTCSLFWLGRFCPVLGPPAILCCRTSEGNEVGHLKAHFVLDNLSQRNVRHAKLARISHKRPARASIAGV